MPLDVLGCTRATLKGSACPPFPRGTGNPLNPLRGRDRSLQLFSVNQEFPVSASHKLALITSLPFVHTARRYYRLNVLVRYLDWTIAGSRRRWFREDSQTWAFRGSKSRNKVSVGEPAEGSLSISEFLDWDFEREKTLHFSRGGKMEFFCLPVHVCSGLACPSGATSFVDFGLSRLIDRRSTARGRLSLLSPSRVLLYFFDLCQIFFNFIFFPYFF